MPTKMTKKCGEDRGLEIQKKRGKEKPVKTVVKKVRFSWGVGGKHAWGGHTTYTPCIWPKGAPASKLLAGFELGTICHSNCYGNQAHCNIPGHKNGHRSYCNDIIHVQAFFEALIGGGSSRHPPKQSQPHRTQGWILGDIYHIEIIW